MVRESQKRARDKYNKEKSSTFTVRFYPSDSDVWNHLQSQDNKAGFVKELIRQHMENNPK